MIEAETLFRTALVEAGGIDVAAGTARLSFVSEKPVLREKDPVYGTHHEVLSLQAGDFNYGFLDRGGPVLLDHQDRALIGSVVAGTVAIGADGKARATIRLDPAWQFYLGKIAGGEMPNHVSVGYSRLSVVGRATAADGIPVLRFAWKANEISILTKDRIPADAGVGFGRSKNHVMTRSIDDLLALALSGSRRTEPDLSDYSLAECIRTLDQEPTGLTREAHQLETNIGGDRITGRYVPFAALCPMRRDMSVGTFAQGGATVATDLAPIAAVLRNRVCAIPLGCTTVQGLRGQFGLPRETAAVTPQSLGETDAATPAFPIFDQPAAAPKRISVQIRVSKQLLIQSPGVEPFLRQEIADQIGVQVDRLLLAGQGGDEPLGIMNTPGVSSVLYNGASWPGVLQNEKLLALANADAGNLGWAVSPATRLLWKQTSRQAGGTYPSFLWEPGSRVNDSPAIATNQLAGQNQTIFANWADLLFLVWGAGLEFLLDPFTKADSGETVLSAHLWLNSVLRHPQSFCVSADSGAQ